MEKIKMGEMTPFEQDNARHEAMPIFEVVSHVTRPVIQLGPEPSFVRIDGTIYEAEKQSVSRKRKNADGSPATIAQKFQTPPELMDVFDLVRNRPGQIVVNEVLGSELRRKYPEDGYVGKSFRLIKTKLPGRDYATFEIAEVRLKTAPVQQVQAALDAVPTEPQATVAPPPAATRPAANRGNSHATATK
jgi:hypothetical protein